MAAVGVPGGLEISWAKQLAAVARGVQPRLTRSFNPHPVYVSRLPRHMRLIYWARPSVSLFVTDRETSPVTHFRGLRQITWRSGRILTELPSITTVVSLFYSKSTFSRSVNTPCLRSLTTDSTDFWPLSVLLGISILCFCSVFPYFFSCCGSMR